MNKETFWRVALPLGIVLWTLLIWGQSLLPAKISAAASQAVEQTLVPDAEHMTMEDYVQPKWWTKYFTLPNHPLGPSFFVRKGAHLAEFGVLGVLWCACSRVYGRRFLWLFGLPIGVIDECLQLVSGRGALVADAIVDVAGYLLGCGLMLAIGWIWRKKQK
ncbi:MAG: VanZ family protein [Clostridia bacterium]|nr:VanZ family protein [Clostridia bacterium]